MPLLVRNNWIPNPLIRSRLRDDEVASIYLHDLVPRTFCAHFQRHGTVLTVLVAVAVAGVEDVLDLLGGERDETEAVRDEFIGEHGGVGFDFDEVDRHGGYFGEDGPPEGVGEGEVCVGEGEVNEVCAGLVVEMVRLWKKKRYDLGEG